MHSFVATTSIWVHISRGQAVGVSWLLAGVVVCLSSLRHGMWAKNYTEILVDLYWIIIEFVGEVVKAG